MSEYMMDRELDDVAYMIERAVYQDNTSALAAICIHLRAKAEWWRGVAQERERLVTVLLERLGPVPMPTGQGAEGETGGQGT